MDAGRIFDIKRFAIHDGPGIRTTVFLKGCSLSCAWCHNPESHSPAPEVLYWEDRCTGCGTCVAACPQGVIRLVGGRPLTDRAGCTGCGTCVAACPWGARQLVGEMMTVEEVMQRLEKDRLFYDESGGGITLSGGEPLDQPAFCRALLSRCREVEIHTALDTCGQASEETLLSVAALADLILYDLKLMDPERHRSYTGASNERILSNLRRLDRLNKRVWLRIPLIPGINDDAKTLREMAGFVAELRSVERVQVLPYHRAGLKKYERLERPAPTARLAPPSPQAVEQAVARLRRKTAVPLQIGG